LKEEEKKLVEEVK